MKPITKSVLLSSLTGFLGAVAARILYPEYGWVEFLAVALGCFVGTLIYYVLADRLKDRNGSPLRK